VEKHGTSAAGAYNMQVGDADAHARGTGPALTTREARDHAKATLPGVEVRRLTFWRYLVRWQKPTNQAK
jgi:hypothetical protein